MKRFCKLSPILLFIFLGGNLYGQIRLPRIIRDSMVLQRDTKIRIWGWAKQGERVTVRFQNKNYRTRTAANGQWSLELPPLKAGGPYGMDITGSNKISLNHILIGDVWFCSGQSNMVHQMNIHDVRYADEIAAANDPDIRQFWIPTLTSLTAPEDDLPTGYWKPAVGEDVRPFSAVAYFFAKKLYAKYHIPIGIINSSVGGTPIEAWTSEEGLKDFNEIISTIEKNKDTAYVNGTNRRANAAFTPPQPRDQGLTGPVKWYDPAYHPTHWRPINIPGYWEDQGIKGLNGAVWFRREIEVPASMTGKPAKVFLGRIVDADMLYINGTLVGNTTYQYPQRRYKIPDGVLKAGKNLFVIRVTNNFGKGGFVTDKPYMLIAGNDTIDLKGYWDYKVGEVYVPRRGGGFVPRIAAQNQPTALYNAMVAPVIPYTIKGILWYQGESNAGKPKVYADLMSALILDWRNKFGMPNAPFIYAQLPNFMDVNYLPEESNWAELRFSQLKALKVPNTAMTVNIDLGEWNDIHPDNKKDVGERMALAAEKIAYGENIVASGPIYKSMRIQGSKIILTFDDTGSGLIAHDGEPLSEFEIAGTDKKYVRAQARIEGNTVVVWSEEINDPKSVRYAWADNPFNPNLYNKEGLPASPFETNGE